MYLMQRSYYDRLSENGLRELTDRVDALALIFLVNWRLRIGFYNLNCYTKTRVYSLPLMVIFFCFRCLSSLLFWLLYFVDEEE